ncbi:hypothetical protein HH310_37590 [Actinoplanes sp. TBRC 11911]|uniref:hypothetical protein n=1 Tax=Actinoplanes sp. TBRC 11911 TaxID=2729386 RepID=UPI00145D23EF|nr:hypothetical protein [Actinoplanes sp. TBRC 11911]NMO56874.1 hypothetical protein [Actinoplanes sp. TBRC 11911]
MTEPRVLFVRTARNDQRNVVVLTTLASAVQGLARLEVVGDPRDLHTLETGSIPAAGEQRIASADVIVLHVSPKDIDFPDFPFTHVGPPRVEDLGDAVLGDRPLAGRGLLRGIGVLDTLGRLPDTLVVVDGLYQGALDDLIALGGILGEATDEYGIPVTPRLSAADRQVGLLREAFRGITYDYDPSAAAPLPGLALALRTGVSDVMGRRSGLASA